MDAIASIPPIYFHLPEYAIAKYWNDMSAAAPNTEFVIYNIPQLAGTALTMSLLKEMLKNPNVVAVKNSSMPTQDIQMFKDAGIAARGEGNFVVFNGPDEQFVSGRVIGADGGIGGTYAVMPELYLAMNDHINKGEIEEAQRHPVRRRPHHLQDVRSPRQPVRRAEGDPAPDVRSGAGRRARARCPA